MRSQIKSEPVLQSNNVLESGICVLAKNGRIVDFNCGFHKLYAELFGFRLEKGSSFVGYVPERYRPEWSRLFQESVRGKNLVFIERIERNGRPLVIEVVIFPIEGIRKRVCLFTQDITELYNAGTRLSEQSLEVKRLNDELDKFVYSASHDLRAPLMSVKGLVKLIKIDHASEQTLQYYLSLIDASVDKLDDFLIKVVQNSMASNGDVRFRQIDFDQVLDDCIAFLRLMNHDVDQLKIIRNIQKAKFVSDPDRLGIIFRSIVSNAISFRNKRTMSWLRIDILVTNEKAVLRFADNGIGIEEKYYNKVFDMFFRASIESRGCGLGLYMARKSVDKLGGTISVDSRLREGSTFSVELPVRRLINDR